MGTIEGKDTASIPQIEGTDSNIPQIEGKEEGKEKTDGDSDEDDDDSDDTSSDDEEEAMYQFLCAKRTAISELVDLVEANVRSFLCRYEAQEQYLLFFFEPNKDQLQKARNQACRQECEGLFQLLHDQVAKLQALDLADQDH